MMGSFIERAIEKEIETINDHLPSAGIPLCDLLNNERPTYVTRAGETSAFHPEEIDFIAKEIPERYHGEIRLPIILLRRMDLGPGLYTVAGTKPALFFLHKILGQVDLEWEDLAVWRQNDTFARPQVQMIRRRLPTTTCIGFVYDVSQ
ncbi:MAG: DUF61 family protein [Candidatus Thorarchaeota archaeon]